MFEVLLALFVIVFMYIILTMLNPALHADIRQVGLATKKDPKTGKVSVKVFSNKKRLLMTYYENNNLDHFKIEGYDCIYLFNRKSQVFIYDCKGKIMYEANEKTIKNIVIELTEANKMFDIYNWLTIVRFKSFLLQGLDQLNA